MSFAWSFSSLSRFRNCARQYYHVTVAKDFKEIEGDANKWGHRVHEVMAKAVKTDRTSLPEGMEQWKKWVDYARQEWKDDVQLWTERKLAVDSRMKVCDFFDKKVDPWLRVVLDVMLLDRENEAAHIIDWKTGKNMDVDSLQLPIAAAVVFVHHPEVQVIQCDYVWMAQDAIKTENIERADLRKHWAEIAPMVANMIKAQRDRHYPATPSGLCVKYCPVTTCEFHGRGNR